MKRSEKKRKKKLRGISKLFLFAALFIGIVVIFIIYQYNQGLSEAGSGGNNKAVKNVDPFAGPEPQFGEINVLLIGSDGRGNEKGRSDTLMIGHYTQKSKRLKVASIMRDTYVDIPDYGMQKINAAYSFGGPELLRKTIKENFDVDINYYATINFEGFSKMTDLVAPNGIDVDIPEEMSTGIGMTLHPGKQTLHGEQVLGYVRFRKDRLSDFGRVQRQQEVLSKLKDAVSLHSLVNLPKLLGVAHSYIDTNVSNRTLLSIGKGLNSSTSKKLESLRIPLQDSFENDRVDVGSVLRIDLEKNKEALQAFLSSEDEKTQQD